MTSTLSDPPQPRRARDAEAPLDGATDVVLRDGSTVHVRPAVAGRRRSRGGVPGRAVARRALVSLPGRRHQRRPRGARARSTAASACVATAGVEGTSSPMPASCPRRRATGPSWPSPSPTPGRGAGSRRSCSRTSPQLAEAAGVVTLTAVVHPDNHRMLGVLRDSGFAMDVRAEPGLLEIELPAQLSAAARERFEERDRTAAVAAVRHVLDRRRSRSSARRAGRAASAGRWSATWWPPASPAPCTRSTRTPRRSPAGRRTPRWPRCRRRWSWPSSPSPRRRRAGRGARVRGRGRARARRPLRRLRRGGSRGPRPPGGAAGHLPRGGDAARRTELPGRPEHRRPPSG